MTTPNEFTLQHSTTAQPCLLDEDPVTKDWPMPPVKAWAPVEHVPLWRRIVDAIAEPFGYGAGEELR